MRDCRLCQVGRGGILVPYISAKALADEQGATMQKKKHALLPRNKQPLDKQAES